jgi:branched-chain amino acid transport system permease protein
MWAVLAVGAFAVLYVVPQWVEKSAPLGIGTATINFALIAVIGAVALNLLVGYTGLLSMGHAAFLALGAFGAALLAVQHNVPFWITVIACGAMGGVVGVLAGLPSLRLRGLYLLLSTLSLQIIGLYLFLQYQLHNFGPAGINYDYPTLGPWTFDDDIHWYYLLIVCAGATILFVRNLLRSREGRAFVAVRDSDVAAAAAGVNVPKVKLKAFATSSVIVSVAGALYAYYLGNASQDTYTLDLVIGYYAMVIIGGLGSLTGSVLGALLYSCLPAVLTHLGTDVGPNTPVIGNLLNNHEADVNSVVFGIFILVVLVIRPAGLASMWEAVKRSVRTWPYSS